MDVNEFGQIGKQKGDMQCRLSVLRTQSRFRTWETAAYAPTRYTELDQQYIGGIWRCGKEGSRLIDTDPFTGEAVAEIVQANGTDLDEAYESAAKSASQLGGEKSRGARSDHAKVQPSHGTAPRRGCRLADQGVR